MTEYHGEQYRYWRLQIDASTAGSTFLVSPYEMEIRASVGGTDQCNGGTASASHSNVTAGNLFDNNTSSYWNNGSPGVPSWIQYDFGPGVSVSVGEIAIIPRYTNQAPKDFRLQGSNDNASWVDVAEWIGVTSWSNAVWKYFEVVTVSLTVATSDISTLYAIGEFANADLVAPYALWQSMSIGAVTLPYGVEVGAALSAPFSIEVGAALSAPFVIGNTVEASLSANYGVSIGADLVFTQYYTAGRAIVLPYAKLAVVSSAMSFTYGSSIETKVSLEVAYDILPHNIASASLIMWYIGLASTYTQQVDAYLLVGQRRIDLLSVDVGLAEGNYAWSGSASVHNELDFQSLPVEAQVVLVIGDTEFTMSVDSRSTTKETGLTSFTISLISDTSRLAEPRAARISFIAETDMMASDIAAAVVGPIEWGMLDWPIMNGRVAFHDTTPLAIAAAVANAAGGVIETMPNGTLKSRHLFPVRVPDWPIATPDFMLTDNDIFSVQESYRRIIPVTKVTVRDWQPNSTGRLAVEVDTRLRGLNHGYPRYYPGGHIHVLVHASPGVNGVSLQASAGELWPGNPQEWTESTDLVFMDAETVTLPNQAYAITSWQWLGVDLGQPVLGPDGLTISVDQSGLSVLRVVVLRRALSWKLIAPWKLSGESSFPIVLVATATDGDHTTASETVVLRGEGLYQGSDILEPMASTVDARCERGRAVIDAGEPLQDVVITTIFTPGALVGQLVAVNDSTPTGWRGQVKSVRHVIEQGRASTVLDMVRYVSI